MATSSGRVPMLDDNGRFPDRFAPPSVAVDAAAAAQAKLDAQQARTDAQGIADGVPAQATAAVTAEVVAQVDPKVTAAQSAQTGAVSAKDAAVVAKTAAEAAKTAAEAVGATNDTIMAAKAADPKSAFSGVLSAAIETQGGGLFAPLHDDVELDIWDGFIYNGGDSVSWDASTYDQFIAGIDAKLNGAATKEIIGYATGGTIPIYAYTAGRATAPHVLVNCGMHPIEASALYSGMRFFTEFATNDNQYMAALRSRVRITYIPELNAGNHRVPGRYNPAGVDINRNFPWNWSYNLDTDKGATPLDQAETQALKSVLDSKPIALLIDCHDAGNDSPEMQYSATSSAVHAHREIFAKAAAKWAATNPGAPIAQYFAGATDTNATLRNWGGKYLRWDKGHINGASVLLEAKAGSFAGGTTDRLNRKGARWYASFIYKLITTWLEDGQIDAPYMPYKWWAIQDKFDATTKVTSITAGGRLVDTTTYSPVSFSFTVNGNGVNYLGFPIRHPGRYLIEWNANLELPTGAPATRVDGRLGLKTMPIDGSNAAADSGISSAYIELKSAGDFGSMSGRGIWNFATVPADSLQMVQLFMRVSTAGESAIIRDAAGITLTVTPMPNYQPAMIPVIPRPA